MKEEQKKLFYDELLLFQDEGFQFPDVIIHHPVIVDIEPLPVFLQRFGILFRILKLARPAPDRFRLLLRFWNERFESCGMSSYIVVRRQTESLPVELKGFLVFFRLLQFRSLCPDGFRLLS